MIKIIHIVGASGSGTSTLGQALEREYGYKCLDTDGYFWQQTDPPFVKSLPHEERVKLMGTAIQESPKCVISGSLCGWGDVFIPKFDLVVFVDTPTDIRIERLQKREFERFGDRIREGGDMFGEHKKFIAWAASYDAGDLDMRSRALHEKWLADCPCPVIRVDGSKPIDELLMQINTFAPLETETETETEIDTDTNTKTETNTETDTDTEIEIEIETDTDTETETEEERHARIYPIILSAYNPAWPEWFAEEKANLERLIGAENIAGIHHYGSTSVPGLTAKPTVDILLEIKQTTNIDKLIASLSSPDYICLRGAGLTIPTPPPHLMFIKGYLSDGFAEKVYHIHVVYPCDAQNQTATHDELLFRDYLIAHPEAATEYVDLKYKLFHDFEHNRDGYTDAKGEFVRRIVEKARGNFTR